MGSFKQPIQDELSLNIVCSFDDPKWLLFTKTDCIVSVKCTNDLEI